MKEPRLINMRAELNGVPGIVGRRPETSGPALNDGFGPRHRYRDGYMSTVRFSGESGWEKHAGDEMLVVLEGSGFLLVKADPHIEPRSLSAGLIAIVPGDAWHKIESEEGITLLTITPQPTIHLDQ